MLVDRAAPRARIDLTEQNLYTLAGGTEQVLAGLKDPITLRLFYSRKLGAAVPSYGAYADRVREMLAEYVALSKGKLRLEVLDPEPFSEIEDRALAYGLQGVPVDQSGEQVYFGLAASNLVDDERTIAFFQPERERFLEYDLTRLVYELSNPAPPGDRRDVVPAAERRPARDDDAAIVAVRSARGGDDPDPPVLHREGRGARRPGHRSGRPGAPGRPPAGFVRTRPIRDRPVRHARRQAAAAGRPALGSPGDAAPAPAASRGGGTASSLDKLLNAWGVEAPSDKVVLDLRGAWRVRANPGDRVQAVDYLAWFNLQGESLNRDEVALAQLEQVTVASAGEVRKRDGASVEFVPLLTSSPQSMAVDAARVRQDPNPARLLSEFT